MKGKQSIRELVNGKQIDHKSDNLSDTRGEPIGKSRPNSRIKPRMYLRRSIMYEKAAFC